jgi:hypothetical protein
MYVKPKEASKYFTLNNTDISNKYVTLSGLPQGNQVGLQIIGGSTQEYGVDFDIIVLPEYNSNQVLADCIVALKDYFAIDKWQINQPIILRNIYILLDKITGVQTVKSVNITNLAGVNIGYSPYAYDINAATVSNVVYPSLDPSIFEVKYPNQDIQGRVVNL